MSEREKRLRRAAAAINAVLAEDSDLLWPDDERTLRGAASLLQNLAGGRS